MSDPNTERPTPGDEATPAGAADATPRGGAEATAAGLAQVIPPEGAAAETETPSSVPEVPEPSPQQPPEPLGPPMPEVPPGGPAEPTPVPPPDPMPNEIPVPESPTVEPPPPEVPPGSIPTGSQAAAATPAAAAPQEVGQQEAAAAGPVPRRTTGAKMLKVTQTGSPIGRMGYQRQTLIGLGLNKMHRTRLVADTPSNRGRIDKVKHLVKVEPAD